MKMLKTKHYLHQIKHNINPFDNRKVILKKFYNKLGLVYFGSTSCADQQPILGLTATINHHDNHYATGRIEDYDISVIDRVDLSARKSSDLDLHHWLVVDIDLIVDNSIPDFLLIAKDNYYGLYQSLLESKTSLIKHQASSFIDPDKDFISKYDVFVSPININRLWMIIDKLAMAAIARTIFPFSIEVSNNHLLLYYPGDRLDNNMMTRLVLASLWLARHVDSLN